MRVILVAAAALALVSCSRHNTPPQAQTAPSAQSQPTASSSAPPAAAPDGYGASLQESPAVQPAPAPPQPDAAPAQAPESRPAPFPSGQQPEQPAPAAVVIPAGTRIRVRMEQSVDTRRNRPGDHFEASLISPVVLGGNVVLPRGTPFGGRVTESRSSGRLKGRAILGVELDSFRLNGVRYPVSTAADVRVSGRHKKRNLLLIGGGSGLGAAIGALAGGGSGALIGAGAGAGAGTAGAFFTGRKNVSLPVETPLSFRLRRSVELR